MTRILALAALAVSVALTATIFGQDDTMIRPGVTVRWSEGGNQTYTVIGRFRDTDMWELDGSNARDFYGQIIYIADPDDLIRYNQ